MLTMADETKHVLIKHMSQDVWRRFKSMAALRGLTITKALEEAIKQYLKETPGETKQS